VLNTSANGKTAWLWVVCVNVDFSIPASLVFSWTVLLPFPKVVSLEVDEVKLVATSSDILLRYLVISESFSISAIKCILYFNYFCKMYFVFFIL